MTRLSTDAGIYADQTYAEPKRIGSFDPFRFQKPTTTAKSERADLIGQFQARINQERIGTPWPTISARGVAMKVAHMPTGDLYGFLKMCEQGQSFGKVFFGALKSRT